jgi:hypothetical protein
VKRQREGAYGPIIDPDAVPGPWRAYQRMDGAYTVINRDAPLTQRYPVFSSEDDACEEASALNAATKPRGR